MKILMLQDTYPPYLGGIALACQRMAEALADKGHQVDVVTTDQTTGSPEARPAVLALLKARPARPVRARLLGYPQRQRHNRRVMERLLHHGGYDIVMVWKLWEVSDSVLLAVQRSGIPVVYYIHDGWLIPGRKDRWQMFWEERAQRPELRSLKYLLRKTGTKAVLQRLLTHWFAAGPAPPDGANTVFVSRSCLEEYGRSGLSLPDAAVIPNGVDLRKFHDRGDGDPSVTTRMLCVGRIEPLKGLHVLVEALAGSLGHVPAPWTLDVVGPVQDKDYLEQLQASVSAADLSDRIHFRGAIANEELPQCYRDHDVLVFPSTGTERFPLVIIEAMASGLAVVTTVTGGQREFMVDGRNCLFARAGDARHLGERLRLLHEDVRMRGTIAEAGAETVRRHLSLELMCEQMEAFLAARLRRN